MKNITKRVRIPADIVNHYGIDIFKSAADFIHNGSVYSTRLIRKLNEHGTKGIIHIGHLKADVIYDTSESRWIMTVSSATQKHIDKKT